MKLKDIVEILDADALRRLAIKQDEWIKDLETANESWKEENRKSLELADDRADIIIKLNTRRDDAERELRNRIQTVDWHLDIFRDIAHAINSKSKTFTNKDVIESVKTSLSNLFTVDKAEGLIVDDEGEIIKQ